MKLIIGQKYLRADGSTVTIGGPVRDHAEWVWSIQGDWYDQKTGRFVAYDGKSMQHYLLAHTAWRTIVGPHIECTPSKLYPKIQISHRVKRSEKFEYVASTNWARTCVEAKARYLKFLQDKNPDAIIQPWRVMCRFAS